MPRFIAGIIIIIGILAAVVTGWLVRPKFCRRVQGREPARTALPPPKSPTSAICCTRPRHDWPTPESQKDAKIGKLPTILLIGETASAKTTTMVHSGLEPELLAGQVYEENNLLPTPAANLWFTQHTVFVETAGKLLADTDGWKQARRRACSPRKLAALLGTAEEAPRAALVCVDAETLTSPDADALAVTARKLRARLGEVSQLLGINLPVYVLFTRTDRLPFFTEYVSRMNDQEVTQILGVTLPIVTGNAASTPKRKTRG